MTATKQLFISHNLRCTPQRRALYEALAETTSHPTAEELYQLVRQTTEQLSRATVYNTLETLCEVGLVRKLPTGCGYCRYDADTREHVHLCFRQDGTVCDVPGDLGTGITKHLPQSVIAELEQRLGVEIDGISIQLLARRRDQPD